MGEDVNTVSPTLGFIIKTIDYDGYKLNIWDVGGQRTLRSYWRNYFEKTDALIWVVDATDRLRIQDCRDELHSLLQEEVRWVYLAMSREGYDAKRGQRLSGASLLIFANKTDVEGCMDEQEIGSGSFLRRETGPRLTEQQQHSRCGWTRSGHMSGISCNAAP
ncbi:Small GTPase superfamily, ARF/SAR type [Ophiocordyceps sinensis CO18]|uniref:Small GTPase superfamily, ARF/SAR type n=1 Tax=Ophiocordyceps sinensis (strain Co18 / CGMCC 3.14243) TaxID=911162 RepID=T5AA11_OPHSC|nr:Small GTPase superfamily, ARF/SAR type [Ophiocordyceps sinensis CO18]